jgi:hypothetical protein
MIDSARYRDPVNVLVSLVLNRLLPDAGRGFSCAPIHIALCSQI